MAPATLEAAANRKAQLIRKATRGGAWVGRYGTAPLLTTLVATGGQIELPATYRSSGWLSEDGLTKAKSRDIVEIKGWSGTSVLRQDVTGQSMTVNFKMIEDNRVSRELYDGVDLSATTVATTGELKYEITDVPDIQYWRCATIFADGSGSNLIYSATAYHKMSVGEVEDITENNGDSPVTRGVTMTAIPDDVTGTIATNFLFGPGVLALGVSMGYTLAT